MFSAEISSADAILFMLSTSLSEDLFRRFIRPNATDHEVLRVARWAAIAGGGFGVLLAVVLPSVISSLSIFYSLLGVSLLVPIVGGLHVGRAGIVEALAAIAGGMTISVALRVAGMETTGVWNPYTWGLVSSVIAFAASLFLRKRSALRGARVAR